MAELRERENNTVQTGQVILARQRSREGHFDPHQRNTGVAKSTQDRLNNEKRDENKRHQKSNNVSPRIVNQTEYTENGQHLGTRNFSKGTFEKNLDSVEGYTAEDNQCSLEDDYVNVEEEEEEEE